MAPDSWLDLETITVSPGQLSATAGIPIDPARVPVRFFRIQLAP